MTKRVPLSSVRAVGFALALGRHVRPFITPDHHPAFEDALRADLPTPFNVSTGPRYGV